MTNTSELPVSILSPIRQDRTFRKQIGRNTIVVCIRWDDTCRNGRNTFAVTCDVYLKGRMESCGMQHDLVKEYFPEIAYLCKWHLVMADGPMHYIDNTTYHASNGALEYARSTAVWPTADLEQLQDVELLKFRLPELMKEFKKDVEALGFVY